MANGAAEEAEMAAVTDRTTEIESNKETLRRMLASLNSGDVDGFCNGLAPDYVRHCQAMPTELQELRGRETMCQWLMSNRVAFPDYHEEIEWVVGEGNFLAWRSVGTGTQTAPMGPFPATGRRMAITIIGMHRFDKGRIVETWTSWDNLAALTQLGLLNM